jgi:hypothetical protein
MQEKDSSTTAVVAPWRSEILLAASSKHAAECEISS